jgi:malonyl-CoA decarboxylase
MTPSTQTSSGLSNSKLVPVDRAKQLATALLSERGEASGAQVARELHHVLRALDADDRHSFQRYLATEFQPDKTILHTAAERYLADTTAEAAAALALAADPPRQELLRRMNMAPGGTGALIAMRSEITAHLHDEPELKLLDADLRHLLSSWFNRGFLELRQIDWQSPAAVLEKLIAHEAVHEIKGWDDLRRRLAPDRRCFAFFHPALPGKPLIFVEVALVEGLATAMPSLLARETDEEAARAEAARADTAIFYSISNCQDGLRGISFGNFLIKQVVEELQAEFPQLEHFSTLSPVPGFRRWLMQRLAEGSDPDTALLPQLERDGWWHDLAQSEKLRPALMRLCALYLTRQPSPGSRVDPPPERSRNPSASWSTISTTMTASRTTTRPSCATGPSCVRPTSMHCSKLSPWGTRAPRRKKGGERRYDIETQVFGAALGAATPWNQTFTYP